MRIKILFVWLVIFIYSSIIAQEFKVSENRFLLTGNPFRIFSGEMHYNRIPKEYWKDRLTKLKAAGLNTLCTYVFWNQHEPTPGNFDFSGSLDVAEYIRVAHSLGLKVLLRPGPYVCSEWDLGGLPAWLLKNRNVKLRCMDEKYMMAVERYFMRLGEELKDLQITNSGPIIMVQVENEYGSYGNDKEYMNALKQIIRKAGFNVELFTSDGPAHYLLESGTLDGVVPVVNFGGNPQKAFEELDKFRNNIPHVCGEFWCGWFTHWRDEKWGTADWERQKKELQWMLENNKSFNLYMFHGGTNFGFYAGANFSDKYEPDVTSYDYDSPLDEAGRPTQKYWDIREMLSKYQPRGTILPEVPNDIKFIEIPEIKLEQSANLFDNFPTPIKSVQPKSMEEFDQSFGFILYRTKLIGPNNGTLKVTDLNDYGLVYVDGKFIGTIDRTKKENTIVLPKTDVDNPTLEILVEGMGRINFGQQLIDRKGITERVTLGGVTLMNWEVFSLPMDTDYLSRLNFTESDTSTMPKFFRDTFTLNETGDTFIDMSKWQKGVVWINGNNLGRYWNVGPQQRLYCPAPLLKKGENVIVVFELHGKNSGEIKGYKNMNRQ
jgi:beta-galactosidase GanA